MVRAIFFLLVAFRVTVCPVVCASGGDFGYCCHGCTVQAGDAHKDECSAENPASQYCDKRQAIESGCQCCKDEGFEDAAQDRLADPLFVGPDVPSAPAREDGLCNGDCACKVLPEKGKVPTDSRATLVVATWYRSDASPCAIGFCSHRHNNSRITNQPDGKAVRISRCSLLI